MTEVHVNGEAILDMMLGPGGSLGPPWKAKLVILTEDDTEVLWIDCGTLRERSERVQISFSMSDISVDPS